MTSAMPEAGRAETDREYTTKEHEQQRAAATYGASNQNTRAISKRARGGKRGGLKLRREGMAAVSTIPAAPLVA